jgi:hypothetical protein
MAHPHWISPTRPCLGDFEVLINENARGGNLEGIVYAYIAFLSQYAPSDGAGQYYGRWSANLSDRPSESTTRAPLIADPDDLIVGTQYLLTQSSSESAPEVAQYQAGDRFAFSDPDGDSEDECLECERHIEDCRCDDDEYYED